MLRNEFKCGNEDDFIILWFWLRKEVICKYGYSFSSKWGMWDIFED